MQNVCVPEVRGSAFAVFALTDDLGKGFGPALVYLFIEACNGDRQTAFSLVVCFWLLGGALLGVMACTVVADEEAVQCAVTSQISMDGNTGAGMDIAANQYPLGSGRTRGQTELELGILRGSRRDRGGEDSVSNPLIAQVADEDSNPQTEAVTEGTATPGARSLLRSESAHSVVSV